MMTEERKAAAPRKQHYVPQFYLRGFTNQNGQLFVVDATTRNHFWTSPQNVAAKRDFNRVDADGVKPDVVERALAKFESEIAPGIERVRKEAAFMDNADRNAVVNLICALALRNPRKRENIDRFMSDTLQLMAEMALATKERWEGQVAQMKADGVLEEDTETDYDAVKKMVKEKKFKFRIAKEFQISLEVEHFDEMLPYFSARRWQILKARADTGGFVTTDHPVCLRWSKAEHRGGRFGPGYGLAGTDILFPLSSELGLIGRFDGNEVSVEADLFTVSSFNTAVIGYASSQIYAADNQYYYMRPFPQAFGRGYMLVEDPNLKALDEE
jgi:Protein of unknown function (DUF4238)